MDVRARPVLTVEVPNRAEFMQMYTQNGRVGGMFVAGAEDVPLGETLDLEIRFVAEQVVFHIRGQARWRRSTSAKKKLPTGVGLEFLEDEGRAHRTLLAFAQGADLPLTVRSGRRLGLEVPVKVKTFVGTEQTVTDDISEGGAFIYSDDPPPVGSSVDIKLLPPGSLLGIGLKAVVAWRRDEGRRGFGVEFLFDSGRKRDKVRATVGRLKKAFLREWSARRR
jgi:Tfp pilus assembly protein PilZ